MISDEAAEQAPRGQALSLDNKEQIRAAIRERYGKVAGSAANQFNYSTGRAGAEQLGYEKELLDDMSGELVDSFCGVGNPFTLGDIVKGERLLDVGCGAGFDLAVARRKIGEKGHVAGVDLTAEMVEKARTELLREGFGDVEVKQVDSESLPFAEQSFDVVLSNGVINLSPAKGELFAEIFRVLAPGGRLQIADMMLHGELAPELAGSLKSWSQ